MNWKTSLKLEGDKMPILPIKSARPVVLSVIRTLSELHFR